MFFSLFAEAGSGPAALVLYYTSAQGQKLTADKLPANYPSQMGGEKILFCIGGTPKNLTDMDDISRIGASISLLSSAL